jgi:O-antigen ligase
LQLPQVNFHIVFQGKILKSTTPDITNNINHDVPGTLRPERADRWGHLPLLTLILSTGLPLNYELPIARPMPVSEVSQETLAAVSDANSSNSILYVLFLGGLYCCAGWMLLKKPRTAASLLKRQWPVPILMLFIVASVMWTYSQEKVLMNIVHNMGVMLVALTAAIHYRSNPWNLPKHLGYTLGINTILNIGAVFVIPAFAIDWYGRWHGLTTHPNTLGSMSFVAIWANGAVLVCKKHDKYHIHLILLLLAMIALIGANSVTSMLTSGCSLAVMYALSRLNGTDAGQKFYVGVLLFAIAFTLGMVLLGETFDLSQLFGAVGRDGNFTGRTSIWDDAAKAISKHPMSGWSFDDHAYLIKSNGMGYPSYHNGYLDLTVSGGAIGIGILFLILGTWILEFTKPSRTGRNIAPFSAALVIAYLIHNLTEASFVAPRDRMWIIFLALVFLGACRKYSKTPGALYKR